MINFKTRQIFFIVLGVFVFGGVAVALRVHSVQKTPEEYARAIVAHCAEASNHTSCYEQEVPKLLVQGVRFEDAFEVAYIIQQLDQTGEYCHRIGHELGSKETAKDTSKWKEVARRTPLGKCLAGGLHGAFQERFKQASLSPAELPSFEKEMQGFCDVQKNIPSSSIDLSMCAHGLGHLFLFATGGDIQESVRLCSAIVFKEEVGVTREGQELSCFDGMFMQLFEPHDAEEYALIQGHEQTTDTVGAFCTTFLPLPKAACVARSAPLFYKNLTTGAPRPLDCGTLTGQRQQDACFSTQLRLFARDTFFNLDATDDYCATYPENKRGWCYASAGSFAFMAGYDYEQPFRFCARAETLGVGDQCYETLAQFIPFVFSTDEKTRASFCKRLPAPYMANCIYAQATNPTPAPSAQ